MGTDAQRAAGVKSGIIRGAKRDAKATNEPVDLPDFGQRIYPDGSAAKLSDVLEGNVRGTAGVSLSEPFKEAFATKVNQEAEKAYEGVSDLSDPPGLDGDEPEAIDPPAPMASLVDIVSSLKAAGLSDAEAMTIAGQRLGIAGEAGPPQVHQAERPRTPGQGEQLGPDPAMVAAYLERRRDYVAPKLNTPVTIDIDGKVFTFAMKTRDAEYVHAKADQETIRRRRQNNPVSPAEAMALIIGEHKRDDQEYKMWSNPLAATGPAQDFNPAGGTWNA